jgi:hypothetical protein
MKHKKNINNHSKSLDYLYSHFINMDKINDIYITFVPSA